MPAIAPVQAALRRSSIGSSRRPSSYHWRARAAALIRFEAARARQWYDDGLRLLPMLDRRSAACTGAMAGIYHRLLGRIETAPLTARAARTSLPTREKALVAVRAIAGGRP